MSQEEKETNTQQEAATTTSGTEPKKERRHRRERHGDSERKVQEMGEKLAEINDKYLRLYSEYENYRKRTNTEKADLIINGSKEMIKAILPVVDDMERALTVLSDDDTSKEGVQLIYNKLMNILSQRKAGDSCSLVRFCSTRAVRFRRRSLSSMSTTLLFTISCLDTTEE
jgi:molecular chaperone GrpE